MNRLPGWITISIIVVAGIIVVGTLFLCIIKLFRLEGFVYQSICSYIDWTWLAEYQAFVAGSIGAILLFLAATVAISQLGAARRISYADLLIRLSNEWNSEPYIESRKKIFEIAPLGLELEQQRKKLQERLSESQQKDVEDYFILTGPIDFFECLAFLIRRGYIPRKDVKRTYGEAMVNYFNIFKYCIDDMRSVPGNENAYVELEAIADKLMK